MAKNYRLDPSRGMKAYKDDPNLIVPQMDKYKKEGFPEHFGHVISGIMFRRHNEQDCIDVMKTWWEEIKYHSHLCQLSLGYSFSPFNSQNTIWFKAIFPLLYLPVTCNMRCTDIWRGLIALNILQNDNKKILFFGKKIL